MVGQWRLQCRLQPPCGAGSAPVRRRARAPSDREADQKHGRGHQAVPSHAHSSRAGRRHRRARFYATQILPSMYLAQRRSNPARHRVAGAIRCAAEFPRLGGNCYASEMPTLKMERAAGGRVAGVDEVGRGPLAGPVVAAAVVLPRKAPRALLSLLDDSKKLTELQRLAAFAALRAGGARSASAPPRLRKSSA